MKAIRDFFRSIGFGLMMFILVGVGIALFIIAIFTDSKSKRPKR